MAVVVATVALLALVVLVAAVARVLRGRPVLPTKGMRASIMVVAVVVPQQPVEQVQAGLVAPHVLRRLLVPRLPVPVVAVVAVGRVVLVAVAGPGTVGRLALVAMQASILALAAAVPVLQAVLLRAERVGRGSSSSVTRIRLTI